MERNQSLRCAVAFCLFSASQSPEPETETLLQSRKAFLRAHTPLTSVFSGLDTKDGVCLGGAVVAVVGTACAASQTHLLWPDGVQIPPSQSVRSLEPGGWSVKRPLSLSRHVCLSFPPPLPGGESQGQEYDYFPWEHGFFIPMLIIIFEWPFVWPAISVPGNDCKGVWV